MEKKDIALVQLRCAAKQYNAGDYISCITLSGAAEEILGKIALKRKNRNAMQDEIQYLKNIYKDFNKQIPNDKELIFRINKTKNDLKHNDSGENQWISNDYENEAALLFVKAVKNYFACYEALPKDRIIKNLFLQLTL